MTNRELLRILIANRHSFMDYLEKLADYTPRCGRCDDILDRPGESLCHACHQSDLEENE